MPTLTDPTGLKNLRNLLDRGFDDAAWEATKEILTSEVPMPDVVKPLVVAIQALLQRSDAMRAFSVLESFLSAPEGA